MMLDVAVIGAGPAGSAAAKRCAEHGLETVILEKKRLPRDKVCSGMIIGPLAQTLIKQEFGEIPGTVLSRPPQLNGYLFHTPDLDNQAGQKLDFFIPLTFRKNLDFWMTEQAGAKGVKIFQGAKVTEIIEEKHGFLIQYEKGLENLEIEAKFIIGADGGTSIVRKYLFPQLKVPYNQAYEEWHQGSMELEARYFHWFYLQKSFPGGFAVHQKDSLIILEFGGTVHVPKERIQWAKEYLTANCGFDQNQEPVYRGACAVARLAGGLVSGTFLPAKKNVLLAGEAGGFVLPITGEGIGTGLKSGLLAAESIVQAVKSDRQADGIYLDEIKPMITAFREYSLWVNKIEAAAKGSGLLLRETMAEAHEASLRMF
ncbi:MAG: NAD(P)/FAD-dependent oxidoreductase [Deltaproteobacteria bacterium]|nr:NAD(P)/FAD-dependent oxidoreductase [Deltaproteobacteria bacterium]